MPIDVHITTDTECSMGGAWADPSLQPVSPELCVLGRAGNDCYGTPLIMDILDRHGLKGTFFVETLAAPVVGEAELREAYQQIVARGHDVQLHAHPNYFYYRRVKAGTFDEAQLPPRLDQIGTLPAAMQLEILGEAKRFFANLCGREPNAYRAGSYSANPDTLRVLAQLGIKYDTSYNAAYCGTSCLLRPQTPGNLPWREEGIWEIPVTNFLAGGRLKPLEVNAVSFWEARRVLEIAHQTGITPVTFVLHSFGLFKKADERYSGIRPDRIIIERFSRLCRFLGQNRDRFRVITFSEQPTPTAKPQPPYPKLPIHRALARKTVQAINRAYWI